MTQKQIIQTMYQLKNAAKSETGSNGKVAADEPQVTEKKKNDMPSVARAHWKPGMTSTSAGRPTIGLSLAEFGRSFLEKTDSKNGSGRARLQRMFEALYDIARDRENKQCVAANQLLLTRAYGPALEFSEKEAMLLALSKFPVEYRDRIAGLLFGESESVGISEDILGSEDDESEVVDNAEYAKFEEITGSEIADKVREVISSQT